MTGPSVRGVDQRSHVAAVDGLRAGAAVAVVVFHVIQVFRPAVIGGAADRWLFHLGRTGVALFFVLSGFLLYRAQVAASLERHSAPAPGPWFLRRATRIFPAYWVALAGAVVVGFAGFSDVGSVLVNLGLLHVYRRGYELQGILVSWTLAIEVAFYALLPAYGWLVGRLAARHADPQRRVGTHLRALLTISLVAYGARVWFTWVHTPGAAVSGRWFALDTGLNQWIVSYLDWFAAGMLVAVCVHPTAGEHPVARAVRRAADQPASCLMVAFGAYALLAQIQVSDAAMRGLSARGDFLARGVQPLIALALVVPIVAGSRPHRFRRLCEARPVAWLGSVSYGVYLWHLTLLWALAGAFDVRYEPGVPSGGSGAAALVAIACALTLTLVVAALSWYLLERPLLRRVPSAERPAPPTVAVTGP